MTWKNYILLDKTKLVAKENMHSILILLESVCLYVCLCVRISKIIGRNIYK